MSSLLWQCPRQHTAAFDAAWCHTPQRCCAVMALGLRSVGMQQGQHAARVACGTYGTCGTALSGLSTACPGLVPCRGMLPACDMMPCCSVDCVRIALGVGCVVAEAGVTCTRWFAPGQVLKLRVPCSCARHVGVLVGPSCGQFSNCARLLCLEGFFWGRR